VFALGIEPLSELFPLFQRESEWRESDQPFSAGNAHTTIQIIKIEMRIIGILLNITLKYQKSTTPKDL